MDGVRASGTGIGTCLRELRRSVGRTQADLARAVGMSTSALSRIETGKLRPEPASLQRLLGAMGITDSWLVLDILMQRGVL